MDTLVSFVIAGKTRKKVLKSLSESKNTPTKIASKLKVHRSTISRTLADLQKKKLVKCLTPKAAMGRLYALTTLGKKVLLEVERTG